MLSLAGINRGMILHGAFVTLLGNSIEEREAYKSQCTLSQKY